MNQYDTRRRDSRETGETDLPVSSIVQREEEVLNEIISRDWKTKDHPFEKDKDPIKLDDIILRRQRQICLVPAASSRMVNRNVGRKKKLGLSRYLVFT